MFKKQIILASNSPRRKEILKMVGINPQIMPANIDESLLTYSSFGDYVETLSQKKGLYVESQDSIFRENCIIVAADTIVVYNNNILEKPRSREEAIQMLKLLSGCQHKVYTGLYVRNNYQKTTTLTHSVSKVKFIKISGKQIEYYVDNYQPYDKAGAYGIQEFAGSFVESIDGCFYNIMGFPLSLFVKIISGHQE